MKTPLMPVDRIAKACQSAIDDVHAAMAVLGKVRYGNSYLIHESEFRAVVTEVDHIQKMNQRQAARRENRLS